MQTFAYPHDLFKQKIALAEGFGRERRVSG
jgi:hypothetical protein